MINNKQFKEVMTSLVILISEGGYTNRRTQSFADICRAKIDSIPDEDGGGMWFRTPEQQKQDYEDHPWVKAKRAEEARAKGDPDIETDSKH